MVPDGELLRRYVAERSEAAFTELVQRHVNVVYRTALRRVGGNAHAADDVTQRVFTALARKAPTLTGYSNLVGWLYTSTRFAAAETVRAEQRRRQHEQEAHTMNELDASQALPVAKLEPFLDEILDRLPPQDRDAVILHYFEGRSFVEIAGLVSSTADATRMRTNRALDKLKAELSRRGIASTAAALGTALAAESTIAAPASLASSVAAAALQQAATAGQIGLATKVVAVVRGWPWLAGSATIVAVATIAIALQPAGSKHAGGMAEPAHGAQDARVTQASASPSEVAPAWVETTVKNATAAPASVPPATGVVVPSTFAQLSTEEKNILARLWREQVDLPKLPGGTWGLRVGSSAPNYPGVARLIDRGWVTITGPKRVVHLTARGRQFCESNSLDLLEHAKTLSATSE